MAAADFAFGRAAGRHEISPGRQGLRELPLKQKEVPMNGRRNSGD